MAWRQPEVACWWCGMDVETEGDDEEGMSDVEADEHVAMGDAIPSMVSAVLCISIRFLIQYFRCVSTHDYLAFSSRRVWVSNRPDYCTTIYLAFARRVVARGS